MARTRALSRYCYFIIRLGQYLNKFTRNAPCLVKEPLAIKAHVDGLIIGHVHTHLLAVFSPYFYLKSARSGPCQQIATELTCPECKPTFVC